MQEKEIQNVNKHSVLSPPRQKKWSARLASAGVLLIGVLLIGGSVAVFAWRAGLHNPASPSNAIPSGQWDAVLDGYAISQIVGAHSDSSVLYACASRSTPAGSISNASPVHYTVVSSSDAGTHWQDVGAQASIVGSCQLAVNSQNSSDVYIVTQQDAQNNTVAKVLKHSIDGGKSWTTLSPVIRRSDAQSVPAWQVEHISVVGDHLFGLQILPMSVVAPKQGEVQPGALLAATRLFESTDAGKTWMVVPAASGTERMSVHDYAVSPVAPLTLYILVGGSWLHIDQGQSNVLSPTPANGDVTLYKSTNGGKLWQAVLKNLLYSSRVQLATDNPETVYVGEALVPQPLIGQPARTTSMQDDAIMQSQWPGHLTLHMSNDAGVNWRAIATPSQPEAIYNWLVGDNGQVYVINEHLQVSEGQQPGGSGSGAVSNEPSQPKGSAAVGSSQTGDPKVETTVITTPIIATPGSPTQTGQDGQVQRYDPATNHWSDVTKLPGTSYGYLLTTTSAGNGKTMLWTLSVHDEKFTLYRYIV